MQVMVRLLVLFSFPFFKILFIDLREVAGGEGGKSWGREREREKH